MLLNNRIFFSDNGTFTDQTATLNNIASGTLTPGIVVAEDAIYVGSDRPFNNRYFNIPTGNASASTMTVEVWGGPSDGWVSAVDILDQTSDGTNSLAQSGIVSFNVPKIKGWRAADTTNITDMTSIDVFDLYWCRFKFTGTIDAGVIFKFVGFKFADDDDLYSYYPDLQRAEVLCQFEDSKTDWDEQLIKASEIVIRDLKSQRQINSANQLIRWELLNDATVHQAAIIIFNAFGDSAADRIERSSKMYENAFRFEQFQIDDNRNLQVDGNEFDKQIKMTRR